jgi:hypothetical protein
MISFHSDNGFRQSSSKLICRKSNGIPQRGQNEPKMTDESLRFYVCDDSQATPTQTVSETEQHESASDGSKEGDCTDESVSSSESSLSEDEFYALKQSYEKARQKFMPWKKDNRKSSQARNRESHKPKKSKSKSKQKSTARRTSGNFEEFNCPRCRTNEHWPTKCKRFEQEPPSDACCSCQKREALFPLPRRQAFDG